MSYRSDQDFLRACCAVDPASVDLQLRVCYCSIFDECWQSDLATLSLEPTPVKACQQPKVPFDQGLLKRRS